jgi:sugar-specific transcriptional regulator TrmB
MNIEEALHLFGLSREEQAVYLLLSKRDWTTVLQLSRISQIKRTTLYGLLDSLKHKGLVAELVDEKTTFYRASDPKSFEFLVAEQEKKAQEMRNSLGQLQSEVLSLATVSGKDTSVQFYRGKRSLQHMEWKVLEEADSEILIFDSDKWWNYLGSDFAEEVRSETVKKHLMIKELTNSEVVVPENGVVEWTTNTELVLNHYKHRLIPTDELVIEQDIYVLPRAIQFRGYRHDEMVGVEIQSDVFAGMFRQIFNLLWNQARVIDSFGGSD